MKEKRDVLAKIDESLTLTPEARIEQFMKTTNELHIKLRNLQVYLETSSEQSRSSLLHDIRRSQAQVDVLSMLYGIVLGEKAKPKGGAQL